MLADYRLSVTEDHASQNTKEFHLDIYQPDTMNYNRAKSALVEICKYAGNGDEKEVKKILDEYPSLINEVIRLIEIIIIT